MSNRRVTLAIMMTVAIGSVPADEIQAAPGRRLTEPQSEDRKTVWNGVYTAEEADRGQMAFETSCASCHAGEDGRQPGAGFTGASFMERWREYNLGSLFGLIRDTMPEGAPARLDDRTYLDIVARILAVNSFPAGDEELSVETLGGIQIEGEDGPQPIPSGSLAQLIGCLETDDGGNWVLTNASEPARTERARGSTAEELEQAQAKALGPETFQLQGFESLRGGYTPDEHRGEKLQVKGYAVQLPESRRIDLLSMETLAATCGP